VMAGIRLVMAVAKVAEVSFMPEMYRFCAREPLHAARQQKIHSIQSS
jgi:hypothetical protein